MKTVKYWGDHNTHLVETIYNNINDYGTMLNTDTCMKYTNLHVLNIQIFM